MFTIFAAKIPVMKRVVKIFLFVWLACSQVTVHAQLPISIESLSDEQLMQLISKYKLNGLSETEMEMKAKEFGLGSDQILLLKKRMSLLEVGSEPGAESSYNSKTDSYVRRNKTYTRGPSLKTRDSLGILHVFGSEIFDNENLSFEPNLSIATPPDYIVGVNDQLVIDVFGISDNTKKLKVTPEGYIRFPLYGPIRVAGLTMEAAEKKIRSALVKIYPGLATGKVSLQVSLGQIRSIHVTLLGEVTRPGTYTLSSLSTLMNALYASGGPNDIGSFRNIQLIRDGKMYTQFDLYNLLLKEDLGDNILLHDDDVIRIVPYKKRVALKGAVKKPAIFDVKDGESAADLLQYAGGFADIAYKERVRINRFGPIHKEILTVPTSGLAGFALVSGDTLSVDSLSFLSANRVQVSGAVYHPGNYGLQQVKDLQELVKLAQPREDAYLDRAIVRRLGPDFTPSFVNFNVTDVQNGNYNLLLQREDSVHFFRAVDLREKYTVTINGEVNKPGTYTYFEKMSVQDLVLLASGYREGAALQKIEVSRRINNNQAATDTLLFSVIKEISLDDKKDLQFTLQPFDIVSIRRTPAYKEQISVRVEGEVLYPGIYTLSANNVRLSDIVARAGGLKSSAFVEGAALVRNTYVGITASDAALLNSKAKLINQQSGKTVLAEGNDSALVSNLSTQQKPVGIRLKDALDRKASPADIFLEEGDILKIPRAIQTIQTFGMVNVPKQIIFHEGLTFRNAIRESGDFAVNASRRHAYAVYPNGEVQPTRNFLFFRTYPTLKAGAEIYVPSKPDRRKLTTGETIGLVSGLTSLLGLIVVLINTSK
ncbi:MAG: capsule biosynthesis protein [Sediminibacterium sp.]|nr:capsule biosynthesis protein [Sediminibacterium sp.]